MHTQDIQKRFDEILDHGKVTRTMRAKHARQSMDNLLHMLQTQTNLVCSINTEVHLDSVERRLGIVQEQIDIALTTFMYQATQLQIMEAEGRLD